MFNSSQTLSDAAEKIKKQLLELDDDTFDDVIKETQSSTADVVVIKWDRILSGSTPEAKATKLLGYYEKKGWDKLFPALKSAYKKHVGEDLGRFVVGCCWLLLLSCAVSSVLN